MNSELRKLLNRSPAATAVLSIFRQLRASGGLLSEQGGEFGRGRTAMRGCGGQLDGR
jgi:hypothetical protein